VQHTGATHWCNTLLQHTPAAHSCNMLFLKSSLKKAKTSPADFGEVTSMKHDKEKNYIPDTPLQIP